MYPVELSQYHSYADRHESEVRNQTRQIGKNRGSLSVVGIVWVERNDVDACVENEARWRKGELMLRRRGYMAAVFFYLLQSIGGFR